MGSLPARPALAAGLGLALMLLATGCDSGPRQFGAVAGTVTVDGRPVTAGRVCFVSVAGTNMASAEIGPDGSYSVPDCPTGEVLVAVRTKEYATVAGPPAKADPGKGAFIPSFTRNPRYVPTPGRYESPDQSGLRATIPDAPPGRPFTFDIPLRGK